MIIAMIKSTAPSSKLIGEVVLVDIGVAVGVDVGAVVGALVNVG
jgi:hypothetical protein